jgi:hypothetical protein
VGVTDRVCLHIGDRHRIGGFRLIRENPAKADLIEKDFRIFQKFAGTILNQDYLIGEDLNFRYRVGYVQDLVEELY